MCPLSAFGHLQLTAANTIRVMDLLMRINQEMGVTMVMVREEEDRGGSIS